jgi:DNA polymerase-3 subunit gamma/tau
LIEQVRIPPQTGKYKIYIIDEVHMLSQAAFNAFLKTLEEPPSYAIFILATTEKHKILPTILSRCQIFDFNRIRVEDMAAHLSAIADREGVQYERDGLHVIAQKADGGLRDALSMFDQIVSFSNKNVTYQAVIDNLHVLDYDYYFQIGEAIREENAVQALLIYDKILSQGFDSLHFISGLAGHFRNLLMAKVPETVVLIEVSDNIRQRYIGQSASFDQGLLLSALNVVNQAELQFKNSKNQRLQIELALLKVCHIPAALRLASIQPSGSEDPSKKKVLNPA